ncbi:hypothetical protein NEOLEDRAFT_1184678 [Neolentinus lepideus HHB14362 ss-1]|uniref:DNA breaking-rejoining enzyme n=1 Tax=Neolentinus lepideus HHB14362 ss-1 TaxID=1314782 RepID=A0A165M7U5_9AGAM|nr:hypothetical protein NEOLEDRAFT_1184678 [Neolentinus lepideus HHB14362 ss-1]
MESDVVCRHDGDPRPAPKPSGAFFAGDPRPMKKKTCKPRAGCEISPSPFCPHVPAVDRLHVWMTPHSADFDQHLRLELLPLTADKTQELAFAALEPNTRTNYGAGLLQFHQFCDEQGIPESSRMPASALLLAGWVNHAPWVGDNDFVSLVKTSASKLTPASSQREKRAPVTLQHLIPLARALDPSSGRDCAVLAVALIAFWGCCHLGELVVPSKASFDPRRHVSRSASVQYIDHWDGLQSAHFDIPFGKVEKEAGARISLTGRHELCPIRALHCHLSVNSLTPRVAPMFAFEMGTGWAPLTKAAFLQRCEEVWRPLQLSRISGHSFRIGGATELLLAGVPPETVTAQGRWKSLAFLLYWRKLEDLLPMMISKSYDEKRVLDLCVEFEQ